jgi:hypothetical protein
MFNAYLRRGGFAVTPSNTTQLGPPILTGLYVASGGTLAIVTEDGSTLNFPVINAGQFIDMRIAQVLATGTTCTGILGLY